ncbi:MAG: mannitol dehydrogenase family protein, partial [Brachybacterium sp.]
VRALPVIAELGGPDKAPGEVAAVAAWTAWVTDRVAGGQEVQDPKSEQIAAAAAVQDDVERVTALLALLEVPAGDPLVTAVVAEEKRLPRP